MKRRVASGIVCLLYVSVALWFGVAHHHQGLVPNSDSCAACAWQHGAVVDVPVNPMPVAVARLAPQPTRLSESSSPNVFLIISHSRAPPFPAV